jgi:serine/threonine protein kinase
MSKDKISSGAYGKIYVKNSNTVTKKMNFMSNKSLKIEKHNLKEIVFYKTYTHPNICEVKDVRIVGDKYELDLARGQICLYDFIKKTRNNKLKRRFDNIFFQIVSFLCFINKQGIVHGDVKPDNILYDIQNEIIKVIDFGGIMSFRLTKNHNNSICTHQFSPPESYEIFKNDKFDDKFDVWSLGVTSVYYLTGEYPVRVRKKSSKTDSQRDKKYEKKYKKLMDESYHYPVDKYRGIDSDKQKLIKDMLYYDKKYRISTYDLYHHKYFSKFNKQKIEKIYINVVYDKNFVESTYKYSAHNRSRAIHWIYNLCKDNYDKLNCFVLTILLIDKYHITKKILIPNNFEVMCLTILMLTSALLLENIIKFDIMKNILGKLYSEQKIIEYSKEVLNTLDFKIYYDTFDWILVNKKIELNYLKIKGIVENMNNLLLNNDQLVTLYLK